MKKYLLLCCLIFAATFGFGQISKVDILLLKSDSAVAGYFTYLNSQKPNQYFDVQRKVTAGGDLVLVCMFPINDESFYKCLAITATFDRIESKEYCVNQIVMGSEEYANFHLAYIKDNFKLISPGKWERSMGNNSKLKVVATFKRISEQKALFEIEYQILDE